MAGLADEPRFRRFAAARLDPSNALAFTPLDALKHLGQTRRHHPGETADLAFALPLFRPTQISRRKPAAPPPRPNRDHDPLTGHTSA